MVWGAVLPRIRGDPIRVHHREKIDLCRVDYLPNLQKTIVFVVLNHVSDKEQTDLDSGPFVPMVRGHEQHTRLVLLLSNIIRELDHPEVSPLIGLPDRG